MQCNQDYVVDSLELHLFFARNMKEHSLFLKAGFTPPGAAFARESAKCFCAALRRSCPGPSL